MKRWRRAKPRRPRRRPRRNPTERERGAPEVRMARNLRRENLEDLGDLFGRVLALSLTLNHPAFQRAIEGFAEDGRVYLVYPDEQSTRSRTPRRAQDERGRGARRRDSGLPGGFVPQPARAARSTTSARNRSPMAPAAGSSSLGLDYVSNDNELQTEPIFNDGYTAPEIYRGKRSTSAPTCSRSARCSTAV